MDLAALFATTTEALKEPGFPAVPVFPEPSGNGQHTDNKGISRISRISRSEIGGLTISQPSAAQAGAGASGRACARDTPSEKREIREQREKRAGSNTCISRSLSQKREIEEETGNPAALRVVSPFSVDPDVQLAFDERAAFLEYECGLPRAEAEAIAASEIQAQAPAALAPSAGPAVEAWRIGLSRLSPNQAPCPDYRGGEWARVYASALAFLDAFGAQAEALGWQTHELFSVHPEAGLIRPDHCGALVMTGGPVIALTADEIRFERTTFHRTPGHGRGVLIWEFRK